MSRSLLVYIHFCKDQKYQLTGSSTDALQMSANSLEAASNVVKLYHPRRCAAGNLVNRAALFLAIWRRRSYISVIYKKNYYYCMWMRSIDCFLMAAGSHVSSSVDFQHFEVFLCCHHPRTRAVHATYGDNKEGPWNADSHWRGSITIGCNQRTMERSCSRLPYAPCVRSGKHKVK